MYVFKAANKPGTRFMRDPRSLKVFEVLDTVTFEKLTYTALKDILTGDTLYIRNEKLKSWVPGTLNIM